jgi:dihydroorotate dehydrogenase (NAD+) catalytic subunit
LRTLPTATIGNIAGKTEDEFVEMAARVHAAGPGLAGLELNLSCPNVSGGLDFATDPDLTRRIVRRCRDACLDIPLIAKLTPNVTDITLIAKAAADAGADAVSAVNTFVGIAVDWRKRKPILGNVTGGLSGPAIKPLALRAVWRIASLKAVPVIGVGGIATLDDVMEFLVAGASAVQIGTANFYDPTVSVRIADALPGALKALGAERIADVVGTLSEK